MNKQIPVASSHAEGMNFYVCSKVEIDWLRSNLIRFSSEKKNEYTDVVHICLDARARWELIDTPSRAQIKRACIRIKAGKRCIYIKYTNKKMPQLKL